MINFAKTNRAFLALTAAAGMAFMATNAGAAPIVFTGTTNVINVNATLSGDTGGGAYSGSTLISPLQETFPAGTYTGSITNPVLNGSAFYTAWSYSPQPSATYLENFAAFNDNSGAPITSSPVINFGSTPGLFPFATAALAFADTIGKTFTFTLTVPTTLDFVVPDSFVADNTGGVSVSITRTAVPEPVALGLLAVVTPMLLGRRRRAA